MPPDVDLSFLAGAVLESVSIAIFDVVVRLSPDIAIWISSSVAISRPGAAGARIDDAREVGIAVTDLLNHEVVTATGSESGTLRLTFENEWSLEVFDDSDEYESYSIKSGNTLIVI